MSYERSNPTPETKPRSEQRPAERPTVPPTKIEREEHTVVPFPTRLQAPVASGLQMKRRNPFGVWLGLPLITLGIYVLVWYYKIHKEMAQFDPRRMVPVAGPMLVLLFLGWTVIAPLISYRNTGARVREAQRAAGLEPTCSPAASWLLAFVFGINHLYLQAELNKVVDRNPEVPTGHEVPLYV
jgi:hypothetical protein